MKSIKCGSCGSELEVRPKGEICGVCGVWLRDKTPVIFRVYSGGEIVAILSIIIAIAIYVAGKL